MKEPSTVTIKGPDPAITPRLSITNDPPFVVVKVEERGPIEKLLPVTFIPKAPFVLMAPNRVVVPVPANCVMELDVIAWTRMSCALVKVTAPTRVVLPMLSKTLISPVPALKVIAWLPSIELEAARVIVPFPALVSRETGAVKVIGLVPEKLMPAFAAMVFVVVIELASEMLPEPFCVKFPFEEIVLPAVVVRAPLLLSVMGPLPVVNTFCKNVKFVPVREIPLEPLVAKAPLKSVVPVPVDWVRELAVTACAVKLRTVEIVKAPREVELPALPENVISAVPEERIKFPGPSRVLKNVIGWFAAWVLKEPVPEALKAPLNWTAPPAVIELDSCVLPVPLWVRLPARDPVAPEENCKTPVFTTLRGPAAVVVKVLLKVKEVPVREIPDRAVVLRAPLNVVVPDPSDCVIDPAIMACVDTLPALVIEKEVKLAMVPTSPERVMFAAPLFKVRPKPP